MAGRSQHGNKGLFPPWEQVIFAFAPGAYVVGVIARSTLSAFWEEHADAEEQLRAWYQEAEDANWRTTVDVQRSYPKVSVLKEGRFVFNICGNKYRLVVHCRHPYVYIRFIGTHARYDRIDAQTH